MKLCKDYLVIDDYLVIADLHIGLEERYREKGFNFPNQDDYLFKKIMSLEEIKDVNKIIILGDLKENIPYPTEYEKIHVKMFLKKLRERFNETIIIKGNHDPGLEKINIPIVRDHIYKNILFEHGHRKIDEDYLKDKNVKKIIVGHTHQMYKIEDKNKNTYYYPHWIVGKYKNIETIIVPSFSDIVTGMHYASDHPGPILRELTDREVFLHDMTKLE